MQWKMQDILGIRRTGLHYCLKSLVWRSGWEKSMVPAGPTDIIISTWPLDFSDIFFPALSLIRGFRPVCLGYQ